MTIDWSFLLPVLSLLGGIAGAWVGVKVNIVRLETQMVDVRERLENARTRLQRHSDDLLIHDVEIEQALAKLEIARVRRQAVQE